MPLGDCPQTVLETLLPAAGFRLQLVNLLRRISLVELGIKRLAGFLGQCLEITSLGPGHGFVAGGPVVGIFFRVARRDIGLFRIR